MYNLDDIKINGELINKNNTFLSMYNCYSNDF